MADVALLAQEQVDKVYPNGEFTLGRLHVQAQKEITAWWASLLSTNAPSISLEFRGHLEELTGCNALLLKGAENIISSYAEGKFCIEDDDCNDAATESCMMLVIYKCKEWISTIARVEKFTWDCSSRKDDNERRRRMRVWCYQKSNGEVLTKTSRKRHLPGQTMV
ncbi:hypothetical protein BDZ91DRAFT_761118 [Kalaharituber pfeilii]|nr:hypothetical protein BDZ91DRAFT_761118 [Kalaharituber pfeilii]